MSQKTYHGEWAAAPEPIAAGSVAETFDADIVICGAGISGVACAFRAAERGADVLVIEQSKSWTARGGNIGVPNSDYMARRGYFNDVKDVAREWIKRCCNRCDERILWKYLDNSPRVMDRIVELVTRPDYGCRVELQGCMYRGDTYWEIVGSHRFFDGPMAKRGMRSGAGDVVNAMYTESVKSGVRYMHNTRALQLKKDGERVTGVYAKRENGDVILAKARRGVVLATGDIGGNAEMCDELSPIANKVLKISWPKDGNLGDGHRMGYWAGGALEDAPFPTIMHPQAYHYSNYCFLHVTPEGKRFYNEDNFVQGKSVAVVRTGYDHAWAICDSRWPEKVVASLPHGGGIFWGQDYDLGGPDFDVEHERKSLARGLSLGVVVQADTPEELAERMGVPVDNFVASFNRYREITDAGVDADFGKKKELLMPIDAPPYYAMKFGPALLAVVGGLRVDTSMNVQDSDRNPIPGLYAIGNASGGRYGVDYPILIPGNSNGTAVTFGYTLGEELAADA